MRPRILVVDDKPNMLGLFSKILRDVGDVVTADGGRRGIERLDAERFDVVVTDIRMPDVDGREVLRHARSLPKPPEVILMTAFATLETAIEALRLGAYDYLTKPFDPDDARAVVERALSKRGVEPKKSTTATNVERWEGLVGRSPAMIDVFRLLERVAPSDASILLIGESGTGKELLARAVHVRSARASRRFVAVNCAAIPSTLMESELFGYAKGAFSGATTARAGLFEEADGGTLFLDEIGDMRRTLQAKLTRALEARAIRRVGESHERAVDVRVVSATHRDLPAMIAQGAFREDLFYRLHTCMVRVPPLRERVDDIPLLIQHFLAARAGSSSRAHELASVARDALLAYAWPGNVRELRSAIERAALLAEDGKITVTHLPLEIARDDAQAPLDSATDIAKLTYREAMERMRTDGVRRYLEALLRRYNGSVVAAAQHADVERESFYRLCRKHGLTPTDFRPERGGDGER